MNYILKPSLEHMTLVKVVAALWNQDDVRASIATFTYSTTPPHIKRRRQWKEIEEKVIEKALHLPLPELLKEKIWGFIKSMGLEIFKWIEYHCTGSYFHVDLPNDLCWTPQGTIDRKRIAQMLLKEESLGVIMRYKLACVYCLEDDVRKLWKEIPEDQKESDLNWLSETIDMRDIVYFRYDEKKHLVHFWFDEIKQEIMLEWQTLYYTVLFQTYAEGGNKAAVEYFLQKLPPEERETSLVHAARSAKDAHVLWYLLCEMNDEQQVAIFNRQPCEMLECFLNWPLQSFFMETADRVWELLDKKHIVWLLEKIVKKINSNHKDWNYQKLFEKLWQKMSDSDKSYVLGKVIEMRSNSWYILLYLFEIKDESKIKEIFQLATIEERKEFIVCYKGIIICQTLIHVDEWSSLKLMFEECLSSKDEMVEFKEIFKQYIIRCISNDQIEMYKEMFNKFFHWLDDLIGQYNERKCVE